MKKKNDFTQAILIKTFQKNFEQAFEIFEQLKYTFTGVNLCSFNTVKFIKIFQEILKKKLRKGKMLENDHFKFISNSKEDNHFSVVEIEADDEEEVEGDAV